MADEDNNNKSRFPSQQHPSNSNNRQNREDNRFSRIPNILQSQRDNPNNFREANRYNSYPDRPRSANSNHFPFGHNNSPNPQQFRYETNNFSRNNQRDDLPQRYERQERQFSTNFRGRVKRGMPGARGFKRGNSNFDNRSGNLSPVHSKFERPHRFDNNNHFRDNRDGPIYRGGFNRNNNMRGGFNRGNNNMPNDQYYYKHRRGGMRDYGRDRDRRVDDYDNDANNRRWRERSVSPNKLSSAHSSPEAIDKFQRNDRWSSRRISDESPPSSPSRRTSWNDRAVSPRNIEPTNRNRTNSEYPDNSMLQIQEAWLKTNRGRPSLISSDKHRYNRSPASDKRFDRAVEELDVHVDRMEVDEPDHEEVQEDEEEEEEEEEDLHEPEEQDQEADVGDSIEDIDNQITKYDSMLEELRSAEREKQAKESSAIDTQPAPEISSFKLEAGVILDEEEDKYKNLATFSFRDEPLLLPTSDIPSSSSPDDLYKRIYQENRQKVQKTTKALSIPSYSSQHHQKLYSCIEEMDFYKQNIATHSKFRPFIVEHVRYRVLNLKFKVSSLRKTYKQYYDSWKIKSEKLEAKMRNRLLKKMKKVNSSRSDTTTGSNFPTADLHAANAGGARGARRSNNFSSDMVRTEAEFEAILLSLGVNPENEENADSGFKVDKSAKEVPMILDPIELKMYKFKNQNGIVHDASAELANYNTSLLMRWSDNERNKFLFKLLQIGKDFSKIAESLPNKTVSDCVYYYYREKINIGVKQLAKKNNISIAIGKNQQNRRKVTPTTNKRSEVDEEAQSPQPNYHSRKRRLLGSIKAAEDGDIVIDDTPKRIKLEVPVDKGKLSPVHPQKPKTPWTGPEKSLVLEQFTKIGGDFEAISKLLDHSKSVEEIYFFYLKYKKKLNLPDFGDIEGKYGIDVKDLGVAEEVGEVKRTVSYWSVKEKEMFMKALPMHGRNWEEIAKIVQTKSAIQSRNYYQNNRDKLGLDIIVKESEEKGILIPSKRSGPKKKNPPPIQIQPRPSQQQFNEGESAYSTFTSPTPSFAQPSPTKPSQYRPFDSQPNYSRPSIATYQTNSSTDFYLPTTASSSSYKSVAPTPAHTYIPTVTYQPFTSLPPTSYSYSSFQHSSNRPPYQIPSITSQLQYSSAFPSYAANSSTVDKQQTITRPTVHNLISSRPSTQPSSLYTNPSSSSNLEETQAKPTSIFNLLSTSGPSSDTSSGRRSSIGELRESSSYQGGSKLAQSFNEPGELKMVKRVSSSSGVFGTEVTIYEDTREDEKKEEVVEEKEDEMNID